MKKVKITVMKITTYEDLVEKYENPVAEDYNVISLRSGNANRMDNGSRRTLSDSIPVLRGHIPTPLHIPQHPWKPIFACPS